MSILYALIARDRTNVLVDFSTVGGNIEIVTLNLLENLNPSPRVSITSNNEYFFHAINEQNLVYLCVAQKEISQSLSFKFLDDIKDSFQRQFTPDERAFGLSSGFQTSFKEILKSKMKDYNNNPEHDQLKKINQNLEVLNDVLVKNIDSILQRDQKIEMVLKKTYDMNQSAHFIKKQVTQHPFIIQFFPSISLH